MDIQRLDSFGVVAPAPALSAVVGDEATLPSTPRLPARLASVAVHDDVGRRALPALDAMGSAEPSYYTQYQIDLKSRIVSVQLVDQASGQVIRQIPSEAVARFAASWDAYVGKLLDHQT